LGPIRWAGLTTARFNTYFAQETHSAIFRFSAPSSLSPSRSVLLRKQCIFFCGVNNGVRCDEAHQARLGGISGTDSQD